MQTLVSGEGVELDLPLAGPGSRVVAGAIDLAVQVIALFVVVTVTLAAASRADGAALTAFFILVTVAVFGAYPIVAEWLSRGRTLGKLAMGLRVVRDDAGPIGFRQAFVRGVCSLVLEKPGLLVPLGTAAGLVTASSSPSWKRIGDLLAGTVVVQDRRTVIRPAVPVVPDAYLWPWVTSADLSRIDDDLALALRAFVTRATGYRAPARAAVEADLARRVAAVVSPPPPPTPPGVLLVTVLAERRRRAGSL
ncbi:RDD family protein [Jatrophihabitans sp. YIM 134969]